MKACNECKWYRQSFWFCYTPECTNNKTARIKKDFITGEETIIHRTCEGSRMYSNLCGNKAVHWEKK